MKSLRDLYKEFWIIRHLWKTGGGRGSTDTYSKYPRESTFDGKKVLNVGCGNTTYPAPNVVNTDLYPVPGVNIALDLSKTPFPFEDNSFDLVIANHILEHVPGWWECFKELARVVKVGGMIEVWLPGDGGSTQLGYRDHINTINHCSFVGMRGTHRNAANAWEIYDRAQLGAVKDLTLLTNVCRLKETWWTRLAPRSLRQWMADHLRNVVVEHGYVFTKMEAES